MKTITPEIIRSLLTLKERYALTDQMIADAIGVKRGTVGRWLRGQTSQMGSQAWFALAKFAGDRMGVQMIEPPPSGPLPIDAPIPGGGMPSDSVNWLGQFPPHLGTGSASGEQGGDGALPASECKVVESVLRGLLLATAEEIHGFESASAGGAQYLGKARVRPMKGGGRCIHVLGLHARQAVKEGELVAVDVDGEVVVGRLHVVHYLVPTEPDTKAEVQEAGGAELQSTGVPTAPS